MNTRFDFRHGGERLAHRYMRLPKNANQNVRRLQDASGRIDEVTLDSAGKIVNSRIVQGATRNQPR
jgi:hypothetical protein